MTPNKREALLIARKSIEHGESRYICIALEWVIVDKPRLAEAARALQRYITLKLDGHNTLDSWLYSQGFGHVNYSRAKTARLQWIDWMLGKDPT